jgi:hypothetical protein
MVKDGSMKKAGKSIPGQTRSTSDKTQKARLVTTATIALVMLGAAFAAGLVIRHLRSPAVEPPSQAQTEEKQVQQNDPQAGPTLPETPVVVHTPAQEEPPLAVAMEPEEVPPVEPQRIRPQMGQGFGGLNLNLTEEEQARLQQGFMAMFQRFQNMSEEERQTQMARFNAMRERFENMSDQERQQTMGRVQQQIEQWRQNGGSTEDLMNSLSLD